MSGHSKWSQIKRQKGVNDVKKGQVYTKIAKQIVIIVKQGGGDPNTNFSLRMVINKGKSVNMPSDNIDKAIKKGLGEDKNASLIESVTYEAYGFGGVTMLIDALTDNRSRTAADVRMMVEKHGGRIVEAGSLSWQYDVLGLITLITETVEEKKIKENRKWNDEVLPNKIITSQDAVEAFEMEAIDIDGVEDVHIEKEEDIYFVSVYTRLDKLDSVRKAIQSMGYDVEQVEIIKKPQTEIILSEEDREKNEILIDLIEENEDVDNIWTNVSEL